MIKFLKKEGVLLNIICLLVFFLVIIPWIWNNYSFDFFKLSDTDCGTQYIHLYSYRPTITPFAPEITSCFMHAFQTCSKAEVNISDAGMDSGLTTTAVIKGKENGVCKIYLSNKTWGMVNYNEKKDIQSICSEVKEKNINGSNELSFGNCTTISSKSSY